jgi:hypothetical protein
MSPLFLTAALTVGSAFSAGPQVAGPDLSGTWELSVTTLRGPEAATLKLEKSGDKYTGMATRPGEQASADATLKGKAVTIVITAQLQSGPATFTFTGEVAGDTMSGTADLGSRGSNQPWSAKRTASAADVGGTWSIEVDTGQGTGTPSFTFKQEGEKLSGLYKGLFGEAPVTGTIKGNAIEFWVDVTVEGTSVRVTYSGTVDKDTMKGTVKLGDLGEGTFKGTRK